MLSIAVNSKNVHFFKKFMKYLIKNISNDRFLIKVEKPQINNIPWSVEVGWHDTKNSIGKIDSQATYTSNSSYLSICNISFDGEGDITQQESIENKNHEKITDYLLQRNTSLSEEQ